MDIDELTYQVLAPTKVTTLIRRMQPLRVDWPMALPVRMCLVLYVGGTNVLKNRQFRFFNVEEVTLKRDHSKCPFDEGRSCAEDETLVKDRPTSFSVTTESVIIRSVFADTETQACMWLGRICGSILFRERACYVLHKNGVLKKKDSKTPSDKNSTKLAKRTTQPTRSRSKHEDANPRFLLGGLPRRSHSLVVSNLQHTDNTLGCACPLFGSSFFEILGCARRSRA